MKISDVTMEDIDMKTFNTMLPLIWILKIFCLNCNIDEKTCNSIFTPIRSIITALVLAGLNLTCLYYKIRYFYPSIDPSIKITDMIQITYNFGQYIIDLYFVYKYGRHICLQYFEQYKCIDNILNVTYFSVMKLKLLKRMAILLTIWATSSVFDFLAWYISFGVNTTLYRSIAYVFMLIKMLTTLDLIAHMIQIEVRLKIIFEVMLECYSSINYSPSFKAVECVGNKRWFYMKDEISTPILRVNPNYTATVKSLTHCYLLLTEQVTFINKVYGFRVSLLSSSF